MNYPEELRGISIAGAYGYAILSRRKPAELRTWPTNFRGPCLIHVPLSKEWDDSFEAWGISPKLCPKASILGVVTLVDCVQRPDGLWAHIMEQPLLLPEPIRGVPGARGYWKPKCLAQSQAFEEAWKNVLNLGGYPPK